MKTSIFQNSKKNIAASWGFSGLPGDLVGNIINNKAYRKPRKASRKPQVNYKNFQGRNPYNIFIGFFGQNDDTKKPFRKNWPL